MLDMNDRKLSISAKDDIADDIVSSPTNRSPNPAMMEPIFCKKSFFAKSVINAPIPVSAVKMTVVDIVLSPNIPSATICPVIVVPIFAPNAITEPCVRSIRFALIKPMTMTVTAPELCMTAAVNVPKPTPSNLLFDVLEKSDFNLLPLIASMFRLNSRTASKNTPIPASNVKIAIAISLPISYPSSKRSLSLLPKFNLNFLPTVYHIPLPLSTL